MRNRKNILIIDDDPDFLSSLKTVLESVGYQVAAAGSGTEGARLFSERKPDLIICDIMMDKIDAGIRFVREVRERDEKIPIYLLSDIGKLTASNIDIYELGCNGTLQKPYDVDELLRLIKQEMDKK
jgi:DNA-binding response OmpR family regulator